MLVGEQPGDVEDREGRPFVGPAGQLLDWAIEKAGIDRKRAYVTNVVKHFKWVPRGKRRIHSKPSSMEIRACLPWLEQELALVKPDVLVCLGATAAQALLGRSFRVTQERGHFVRSDLAPHVMATVHPSSLLRIEDEKERKAAIRVFVTELRKVAQTLAGRPIPALPYWGAMRRAPSSRIVSPFSIGFSTMWRTRAAYSSGRPRRCGKGTEAPSDCCDVLGQAAQHRRLENAGRDRDDADAVAGELARRRQGERRNPALRCGIGGLADLAIERGDRGGVDDHAALAFGDRARAWSSRPRRGAAG